MSSIRFQSVHKVLGDRQVLHDLSLEVESGERVAILGPSGCGKTTLLRLAAGLIAPDQGCIAINGIPVAEDGRNLIEPEDRQVGMVFQDLALWPHLTVFGNLAFGLKSKGTPKQERLSRIHEMLQLVPWTAVALLGLLLLAIPLFIGLLYAIQRRRPGFDPS